MAAAGVVPVFGPAAAATAPSLVVTPAAVHRGDRVVISGSADSCPTGDTVVVISRALPRVHQFAGIPAIWATVRPGGRYRLTTRIPRTKPKGRYILTARCGGGNLGVLARLTVLR
jgi:hypothetical protein